jgi:hypothetical protein
MEAADIAPFTQNLLDGSDRHAAYLRTAAKHGVGEMLHAMVNQ